MSEAQPETPDWLANWQKQPPPPKAQKTRGVGNPSWRPGMPSPNPAGRPKGIVDRRMQVAQRLFEDAEGIVDAMVAKALEGDTGAAGLILSRVLPSLRAQSEKVQFEFDASAPISRQAEMILEAIASGALAPDVGKQILEAVNSLATIRAVEDIEARIVILEQKQM
ncbi:DUF5681 domain-containing protein [Sphingomonas sp.]|uniref:DUF5681 domain-containing protein n=1 Tax=Sphingomonas sp. TaxID=28214 RepID=UPI0025E5FC29|nr:DUF5681 domain-containing protein [Sphingomonas sp.]